MSRQMRVSLVLLAILFVAGCQDRVESGEQAIEVAKAHLDNVHFAADTTNAEALDWGETWRVSFRYPEGSTGGPVIIVVDKSSGDIVHMETEQ